jgi:hypothetical protein
MRFLLGRQAGQLLVAEQVLALAEAVEHALGDGRVEQVLAGPDGPDGPDQLVALDLLEDIAGRPGHDRGEQGLVVGEAGQHQHLGLGAGGADVAGGLDPGAVGEADVHDDHVGQGLGGDGHGLPAELASAHTTTSVVSASSSLMPSRTTWWSSTSMTRSGGRSCPHPGSRRAGPPPPGRAC